MRKLVGKSGKSISVKAKDGEIFISRSTKVAVMRMSSQKAEAGKGFSQGSSKKTGLPGPINHRAPARVISETINFYLLVREVRAAWKMTRSQPSKIPIGTTKTIGITPEQKFADTITTCVNGKMNFQVFLSDNSGCISNSNLIVGTYSNTKTPDTTYVDSISVLPNGNTVLSWSIPKLDPDVVEYHIIQRIDSLNSNTYIATVNGRTSTSYTLSNTLASVRPVGIFVAAVDSCKDIGNFDQTPRTMFLTTKYNECAYQTELSWTPYFGMRTGIKEYRVYYSVDGGNFILAGTTTASSFTHNNVDGGHNITYFIRVINNAKNITASSNRSVFFSTQPDIPPFLYMGTASISNKKGFIRIYTDASTPISSIEIERSEDGSTFTTVGTIPYNATSVYSFLDEGINSSVTSFYYRAVIKDGCGNKRTRSNVCKTILLLVDQDRENLFTMHLKWTFYEGFAAGVGQYRIYRMIKGSSPVLLTSTAPLVNKYTDNIEELAPDGFLLRSTGMACTTAVSPGMAGSTIRTYS